MNQNFHGSFVWCGREEQSEGSDQGNSTIYHGSFKKANGFWMVHLA
jgi:hypothetical protein